MKKFVWNILNWIDSEINHGIFEWFFDYLPLENKDGSDSIYYLAWLKISYKFCNWVNDDLAEK